MSHFCVYVFTKEDGMDIEEIMAPYSEGLPCAPHVEYTKEQAVAQIREEIKQYENTVYARYLADPEGYAEESQNEAHVNYVKNEFPKKLAYTDEECYEEMKERFDEDMIDEEGNLYTSYNPYSKWDWYTEGGRWKNVLCGKNGLYVNSAPVGALISKSRLFRLRMSLLREFGLRTGRWDGLEPWQTNRMLISGKSSLKTM